MKHGDDCSTFSVEVIRITADEVGSVQFTCSPYKLITQGITKHPYGPEACAALVAARRTPNDIRNAKCTSDLNSKEELDLEAGLEPLPQYTDYKIRFNITVESCPTENPQIYDEFFNSVCEADKKVGLS